MWLFFVMFTVVAGGRWYMEGEFALPRETQLVVTQWAYVSDQIARRADIPREVPLVLWFKESSMQAVNPDNCTGIIGAYDLVRSGERPCFTPGPISTLEIGEQLTIAAIEFKKRCPEITYYTRNPNTLKKCYYAYNAGMGAAASGNPNQSAYVMNNYNDNYRNMYYSDVELGNVYVTALGAWPAHLAIESLITAHLDHFSHGDIPFTITLLDFGTRAYDWGSYQFSFFDLNDATTPMDFPDDRDITAQTCLAPPHRFSLPGVRPTINPVSETPRLTQDIHGCSYGLPGLDISSDNRRAILVAPMSGEVTTYTDRWQNSTIRIENEEWIVWLLHPRSYLVKEGFVYQGDPVGVMGAVGYATGPHVHYTIYDKITDSFVDPSLFIPIEED
ncbi:MAG TPA: M23 family metallopeptidase [Anaerolineae bacterium]|nr:M23 family metallopeptidase [Anaerolineae bacterium]